MSVLIAIALCVGVVSAVPGPSSMLAPLNPLEHSEHTIPEEYIVVFKQDASETQVQEHIKSLNDMLEAFDGVYYVRHTYNIGSFRGYSARMDEMTLERVRRMSEVKYVERNQKGQLHSCKTQLENVGWGLQRISKKGQVDQKIKPYTYKYDVAKQGKGVDIYIVDSGIDVGNDEFENRAKWGKNFVKPGELVVSDAHGTAVAGVAMSKTYGVAKEATAIALRVTDDGGNPILDAILAAFDYVANNHQPKRSVVNASFSTRLQSDLLKQAANKLFTEKGVPVVASAGNREIDSQQGDACTHDPASAEEVITVAASNIDDELLSTSYFGKCVNIIAPGKQILTTILNEETKEKRGTSFAAPFVAGVLAKLMTNGDLTAGDARNKLYELAEKDVIEIPKYAEGTPNRMLNDVCK